MQRPFIVCDPAKCTGCQLCEFVCSSRSGAYDPLLSHIRLVRSSRQPAVIMSLACRLCDTPSCVTACPRQCISADENTGIMRVNKDMCTGCGWCVEACEFGAVTIDHGERVVSMCNLCEDRDDRPRCVEICVYGALSLATPADVAARRRRELVEGGLLPETQSARQVQPARQAQPIAATGACA
jgi:anaerobic carbon-monoxide dehydrogenase iron sulfur subunit